jgi:hypothetical protein
MIDSPMVKWVLRIPAECEKEPRDRLLPMVPQFTEFSRAVPEAEYNEKRNRRLSRNNSPLPLGEGQGVRAGWDLNSKVILGQLLGAVLGALRDRKENDVRQQ